MISPTAVLDLTKALISCESVTPEDGGCQLLIAKRLEKLGFEINHLPFSKVKNLFARWGTSSPLLVFAGHTDVVPPGPLDEWLYSPFVPYEKEGHLYGRGAQDMKSNIAAMVVAVEDFLNDKTQKTLNNKSDFKGSIGFLITSDEEGPSIDGTAKVIDYLNAQAIKIDYCIVGEPSSKKVVGDMLKIGRRGTLSANLKIVGKQGHIAYPHLAENPIHACLPALAELIQTQWDAEHESHQFFQHTCLQISNIHSGTGANNVIPGELDLRCNFRYSPAVTAEILQKRFEKILQEFNLKYKLIWDLSGKPFLTQKGKLLDACVSVISEIQGIAPILSTEGGTSDGRFIAPHGTEVVEMGVCNDTIHQINEKVRITDIYILKNLYEKILERIFSSSI